MGCRAVENSVSRLALIAVNVRACRAASRAGGHSHLERAHTALGMSIPDADALYEDFDSKDPEKDEAKARRARILLAFCSPRADLA